MKKGINKVTLLGRLGIDPVIRYTAEGEAVANLSVATTESWVDKKSGVVKEVKEWHRVVLFDRPAELAERYLKKGSQIYIEGKLRTRKWKDDRQGEHYITEIIVNHQGEFQITGRLNKPAKPTKPPPDEDIPA